MQILDALKIVDHEMIKMRGQKMTPLEEFILSGVWEGKSYVEIAGASKFSVGHIKDIGSELWKLLSKTWNRRITKKNWKIFMEQNANFFQVSQSPAVVTTPAEGEPFIPSSEETQRLLKKFQAEKELAEADRDKVRSNMQAMKEELIRKFKLGSLHGKNTEPPNNAENKYQETEDND